MKILITNDLFDIAWRLKQINKDYTVYFDTVRQKFVLMRNNILELVFPFDELDERAIDHAKYTSVQNIEQIIYDLDKENKIMEEQSIKKAQDQIENEFSHRLRLANG